ncbi:hypothetical protein SAMN05421640_2174 [Ekhidna lutea]|uniref:Dienelactone hydrolase n=1 Tax=Ekhidna lutea TaxID=447679 RepID=A0A239JHZ1_EKHLU|nr:hypothetical protein [Ekhidna lutea]SNT05192.1 hypothetical protein SAMN05421640_2174 [Ekhidna lutea]
MKKAFKLYIVIVTFTHLLIGQPTYSLWKNLEPGPYQVGFKTINYIDKSRSIPGGLSDNRFFPIQISIWYPTTVQWSIDKALPFEHYFFKTAEKNDFNELNEQQKAQAMDIFFNYAKYGLSIEFTADEKQEIGSKPTAAMANVREAPGPFPALLAGHDGGVWKMSTLCEYLASHGYVVISTGPLSGSNRLFRQNTQQVINRRIRTFEIVRGMLDDFPNINQSQIGLLGLNSDGISTLLYQMKNLTADAMVSIDGWEGKNNGYSYSSSSVYYEPANLKIPRMEFQQHESPENESLYVNTTIFDSLTNIDRYSYILNEFGHDYLTGNLFVLPQLDETIDQKHYFWYESVKSFFDAYLKEDKNALIDLWNRRNKNDDFFIRNERIKGK